MWALGDNRAPDDVVCPMNSEPETETPEQKPKTLNALQIIAAVLSAAGGVRGVSKRGSSIGDASTGAILTAVLIFCAFLGLGLYAFVSAIKSAAGS